MQNEDELQPELEQGVSPELRAAIDTAVVRLRTEFEDMLRGEVKAARTRIATPGFPKQQRIVNAGEVLRTWLYAHLGQLEVFTIGLLRERDRLEDRIAVLEERVLDLIDRRASDEHTAEGAG